MSPSNILLILSVLVFATAFVTVLLYTRNMQVLDANALAWFAQERGLETLNKADRAFRKAWKRVPHLAPMGAELQFTRIAYGVLPHDDGDITVFPTSAVIIFPGGGMVRHRTVFSVSIQFIESFSIVRRSGWQQLHSLRVSPTQDPDFDNARLVLSKSKDAAQACLTDEFKAIILETDDWWSPFRSWNNTTYPIWIVTGGRLILVVPQRPHRFPLDEAFDRLLHARETLLAAV